VVPHKVELTVINDDYSGFTRLLASHGLSLHLRIYSDGGVDDVLFDVGPSNYVLKFNVRRLGLDLGNAKVVVLSHRHYDHTGGLGYVVRRVSELGRQPVVVAHPWIFQPCIYVGEDKQEFDKGMPYSRDELSRLGSRFILTRNPLQVSHSTFYLGEVTQYVDVSKYRKGFYTVLSDGELVPDELPDDSGLAIRVEGLGVIVVSGCSHSGIVNIVRQAAKLLNDNIYAVVGGFHMMKYSDDDIRDVVRVFKDLGVEEVYTGHCTGLNAERVLSEAYLSKFHKIHSGFKAEFRARV